LRQNAQGPVIEVISQPFGGAVRIKDPHLISALIKGFNFDSERSKAEHDFRIFISPPDWPALREFVIVHLGRDDDPVLETDPGRELAEEFKDALKVDLSTDQYRSRLSGMILEDDPAVTANPRAEGSPTVRIYRIDEVIITDPLLGKILMEKGETVTDQQLRQVAVEDAQQGGKGRANGVTVVPMEQLNDFYYHLPLSKINKPVLFEQRLLDRNVVAVFDGVTNPIYIRL
jgi:hypothetical protein